MSFIYTVTLIILCLILILLWREEKRFQKSRTHGLANKYWILKERRRYVRFKDEIKIRYVLLNKSPGPRHTTASNISKKGLCLVTYEKLKEKSFLSLELDFPDFSKPVKLTGQVMWTKDLQKHDKEGRRLFNVGIRFFKINPEAEAILLTHLGTLKTRAI